MNNPANLSHARPSKNATSSHPKIKPTATEEEEEASLAADDLTSAPSTVDKAQVPKPKVGNNIWRSLARRSSVASGRDRSIVAASPPDDNDDSVLSSSAGGGDCPRLLTDEAENVKDLDEHEAFMFNMNGSRYSGLDLFDLESSANYDTDDVEDGLKRIDGSAGSRIRVILGATGQSFLLLIDEDDGKKQWQSKSWYDIPSGLADKLKDVEYVHQCSYSSNGVDWFLKARSAKTGTSRTWWSVQSPEFHTAIETAIDGGLEVRVVFGSSSHDQYIVLLGSNGYTLGPNLPDGILTAMDQIYDAETTIARIRGLNADGRFLVEELIDDGSETKDDIGHNSGVSVGTCVSSGMIRSVYHAKGLSLHLQRALETFVENQEIIWEVSIGIADSSWLIIRDEAWDGSVGLHDELALLLDRFYTRHAKRLEEQANRIAVMTEQKRLREQQKALAAAEERRFNNDNNSGKKSKKSGSPKSRKETSNPKKAANSPKLKKKKDSVPVKDRDRRETEAAKRFEERQARLREKILERCRIAGKRREKEDRLHELAWKQLGTGDPVTVLGVSTKGGDVRIVDIDHASGIVRIQLPRGLSKKMSKKDDTAGNSSGAGKNADLPVIPIHDTRRLSKPLNGGDSLCDSTEVASLVSASDKYQAAIILYHMYCENGACACKREFYGFGQRDVQPTPWTPGDRVHVLGYADATVIQSSEHYTRKGLINVQYDDLSTYHVRASQLRPIQKEIAVAECRFQEAQTPAEERALRIRPFYDALTPKNQQSMYRFDEYTCREKIDVRKLQSLADDLRRDSSARRKMLADFQKQVDDHTESSKFEICLTTLEKCRGLEETVYSLFEILKGFPCDHNGHLQHDVQYRHKDIAQRGRLFAVGRSVRILHNEFPRSLTLQGIQAELIAPLTGAFCRYVDCVNSDIQLLCSLGKQMGIESLIPTITDYRNFHDKWLEAIHQEHPNATHEEVKRLVNTILFGGSYDNWLEAVNEDPVGKIKRFTFRLHAETRAIRDQLLNHPRFQWADLERQELEQKGLRPETVKMVLFQRILHSCENAVLGIVHQTFHNCGWRVRAKLFDSLLVEQSSWVEHDLDRMLTIAQQSCAAMGWDVLLVEKPLFGRQNDLLQTIEEARTIVGAVEAASNEGCTGEEFWAELSSHCSASTQATNAS